MKKILVLDNYDSFVYNLVYLIKALGHQPEVFRNKAITISEALCYDYILLSPGPGIPDEAGIMKGLIEAASRAVKCPSIFGVCLGHQAIAEVFGAQLYNLSNPLHGIATRALITDSTSPLFRAVGSELTVGRYHSWSVDPATIPNQLTVTCHDEEQNVLGVSHKKLPIHGVQFHPESILTPEGPVIIANWLNHTNPQIQQP